MWLKIIIVLLLLAVLASLFSGLFFMNRDQGRRPPRTVKALTVRVALSLLVFAVIVLAYHMGWFGPIRL